MNKILTVEEFTISNCMKQMTSRETTINSIRSLIEFHVEAALKAASEKVQLTDFASEFLQEGASEAINKESILNAYPKELIQ